MGLYYFASDALVIVKKSIFRKLRTDEKVGRGNAKNGS